MIQVMLKLTIKDGAVKLESTPELHEENDLEKLAIHHIMHVIKMTLGTYAAGLKQQAEAQLLADEMGKNSGVKEIIFDDGSRDRAPDEDPEEQAT